MPNWVFNSLNDYPKEVYDKYKSDDRDIDFNKIIPEPEEISNSVSSSFNDVAKAIYKYNHKSEDELMFLSPLYKTVKGFRDRVITNVGEKAINNPDKSLNEILKDDDNKYFKDSYNEYINVFGMNNGSRRNISESELSNYIEIQEDKFKNSKLRDNDNDLDKFNTLNDLGENLVGLEEKYGFDNWYDWRCANWGTKWNACDSNYNEELQSLQFNTAWSIPYPIIAKIADDNPSLRLDGYSEEENGWFDEYTTDNGIVSVNNSGDNIYDEETDETNVVYDKDFNPYTFNYDSIRNKFAQEQQNMNKMILNLI